MQMNEIILLITILPTALRELNPYGVPGSIPGPANPLAICPLSLYCSHYSHFPPIPQICCCFPLLPVATHAVPIRGSTSLHPLPCSISILPLQLNPASLSHEASPGLQTRPHLPGIHFNCLPLPTCNSKLHESKGCTCLVGC